MAQNETVLDRELLTTADLCRLFKRAPLTIRHWREKKDLPYVRIPGHARDTIRFVRKDVLAWAKRLGKEVFK